MKEKGPPPPASTAFCWRAGSGMQAAHPSRGGMLIPAGSVSGVDPGPHTSGLDPVPMPLLQQAAAFPSPLALFQKRGCIVICPHAVVTGKK